MSLKIPKCDFCKHLEEGNHYKCPAFPDGIPLEKRPDDEAVECANGIKYEEE